MRLLVNILILLMVTGLVAGGLWQYFHEQRQVAMVGEIRQLMAEIERQGTFYGVSGIVETSDRGYPKHCEDEWFDSGLPVNVFVGEGRPWIDVADDFDESLHPPDPVVVSGDQAGFWYSPTWGIVRARVPAQVTEAGTLALYNEVNSSDMLSLPSYRAFAGEDNVYSAVEGEVGSRSGETGVIDGEFFEALLHKLFL